eukprot:5034685-Prorocentrum_lima.AAC.1
MMVEIDAKLMTASKGYDIVKGALCCKCLSLREKGKLVEQQLLGKLAWGMESMIWNMSTHKRMDTMQKNFYSLLQP